MKQTTPTLQLKTKQTEILTLLYRFRFLNRNQIQILLTHKYHSRILNWLNELTDLKLIIKSYDKSFTTDPAVYQLDKSARKYLKDNSKLNIKPLNRLWRETKYSPQLEKHCLFLVDIYFSLIEFTVKLKSELHFHAKTDLYGMANLIDPKPDAYFAIENKETIKRYFLDILDDLPPMVLRRRVKQYFEYFDSDQWQDNTDKPFPDIILVCPNRRIKSHLFYYIQNKISDDFEINFYLTTWDILKDKGMCQKSLEKVKPKEI
ncbi:MAG: replication-relaxation family protein [Candidatus Berkelbacteria bacterium]